MASVIEVTKAAREALARGKPSEDVSVKFVEEFDPDKKPHQVVMGLRAMAVLHPAHNPHKVIVAVMGPMVKLPPDVPVPRGAIEVAALDELMGVIAAEKAKKELEKARAMVAAAGPEAPEAPAPEFVAPELPETPEDLVPPPPEE